MLEKIYIPQKNLIGNYDKFLTYQVKNNKKVFKDTKEREYTIEEIQEHESVRNFFKFFFIIRRLLDNKLFMVVGIQEMFTCDGNNFYSVFRNRYNQETKLLEFISCNKVQVTVNKYTPELNNLTEV